MCIMRPIPRWILIIGLAFVFGYFGIDKFIHPLTWSGWIPAAFDGMLGMGKDQWLKIFGVIEIVIALGLLLPMFILQRVAAGLAALHLFAVLTQTGWNDIAVRDIGLVTIALALLLSDEQQ